MNRELNKYKIDLMESIINANQQLLIDAPSNNIAIWNLVNEGTSQMWATFDFYVNGIESLVEATYKVPSACYAILEDQILCGLFCEHKRITVQFSKNNKPTYFGIDKANARDTISGQMNFGATPHILAWLVS